MTIMKRIIPHLFVADAPRSIAFYEDGLGFTRAYVQQDAAGRATFAILRRDGIELMVGEGDVPIPDGAQGAAGATATPMVLYVAMSDVAGFHEEVGAQCDVVRPLEDTPWGTREFWLRDPDGFILALCEEL